MQNGDEYMKKFILGNTGIEVTELCFGALPMGPMQKNVDTDKCAEIVALALNMGINFVDTAQAYRTYEPIKMAMDRTGIRPVIVSKSAQKTYEGMEQAVNEALDKLGIDYIDIFHLHAAREGGDAFELFADALKCLVDMKAKGKIKAVGISTHSVAVTNKAAEHPDIDVVFPLINKIGRGIIDGTKEEMMEAIKKADKAGKGVYIMKALAGGNLINEYDESMKYVREIEGEHPIAVGMVNTDEVEFNVRYFNGEDLKSIPQTIKTLKKLTVISALCKSCGTCIEACPNSAISYDETSKARIDESRCLTCGYCTPVCPQFAIRVL